MLGAMASTPNRFLQPQELSAARPIRAWTGSEVFAEGQWQSVRVGLEARGWSAIQIEQIHDQRRQGWPRHARAHGARRRRQAARTGCRARARAAAA